MRADTYFTWTALGVFTMGVSATPVLASVYLPEDALCGLEYDRVNQANGNRPPTMFEPKNSEDQALRCSTENSRDPRKALAIPFLLNDDSSSATDLVNDDAGSSPDAKPFEATAPPSLSETAPASDELEEEMSRVSSAAIPPEVMTPVFSKGFQSLRDVLLFWSPGDILEAIPHQAKHVVK
ncbi:hypothetical protein H4R35_004787 [Dimargaris xerosporica]|nr:hypothetical protein H4R35_004787 [Dimargaris xerosporica]